MEKEVLTTYYKLKAQRMNQLFDLHHTSNDDLKKLLKQSKNIRKVLWALSYHPWNRYVPFVHKSFAYYFTQDTKPDKFVEYSTNIVRMMLAMNELDRFFKDLIKIYDAQIEDLKLLIQDKAE